MAFRREIAKKIGADHSFDPLTENPVERVRALTGKDGADVVIECVGKTAATKQAFDTAAKGATLLLFSVPPVDAKFELPLFDVFSKELTIRGSFVNPDTHARAIALLASGKIQIAPLITHRFPLDKIEEAIKMQMSNESIKVLVTRE
jgi:threonine dehydrogenase-like Zn-dependent dehydrogenase